MRITSGGNVGIGTSTPTPHNGTGLVVRGRGGRGIIELWDSVSGKSVFQNVGGSTYIGQLDKGTGAGDTHILVNGNGSSADIGMSITSAGAVTTPNQPAWSVGLSSEQNITAPTSIIWNQSSGNDCFLQGGVSLNTSNGRITVPVAGKYVILASIRTEVTGATTGTNLNVRRNGTTLLRHYVGGSVNSAGSFMYIETRPLIISCAANDYKDFYFDSVPASFNISNAANTVVRFGGYLIG
jgi:hypothetical protein